MTKKIFPVFFILVCACCYANGRTQLHNNDERVLQTDTTVFKAQLKGREIIRLSFSDSFFDIKELILSNPGNEDTLLIKQLVLDGPTAFSFTILKMGEHGKRESIGCNILALPGDTIQLSFDPFPYIDTKKNAPHNLLPDFSLPFYDVLYFPPLFNTKDWPSFKSATDHLYHAEKERIHQLYSKNRADAVFYERLLFNCDVYYWLRIFDYAKDNIVAAKFASQNIPLIEKLADSDGKFWSFRLGRLLQDAARIKMRELGLEASFVNYYHTANSLRIHTFKPALLASVIRSSRENQSAGFLQIVEKYKSDYGIKYATHVQTFFENRLEGRKLMIEDKLSSYGEEGNKSWDQVVSSLKKVVVVDFWASWCAPCIAEFPYMDSLKRVFEKDPVSFITLNIDEDETDWDIMSRSHSRYLGVNNYRLIQPKKSVIINKLKINSIPRILILADGKIVAADFYRPSESKFVAALRKIID